MFNLHWTALIPAKPNFEVTLACEAKDLYFGDNVKDRAVLSEISRETAA